MSDGFNSVVNSDGHVALKALCVCHSKCGIRSFIHIKSANEYQMPTGYKQLYFTFNYLKHRGGALTAGRVNVLFQGHCGRAECCQREVLWLWDWSFFEPLNLQQVLLITWRSGNQLNSGLFIYTSSRDGCHLFRPSMTSIIFFLDHLQSLEFGVMAVTVPVAVVSYIISVDAASTGALGPTVANWLARLHQ